MPTVQLFTEIEGDIAVCFDLSTSIDLHKLSTAATREHAVAGVTSGGIKFGETVTWSAVHFGIRQQLTTKITAYNRPFYFCDEQLKGPFKMMKHEHYFELATNGRVIMTDNFRFESPFGIAGRLFNRLILEKHLRRLLITRNKMIQDFAESGK